MGEIDFEIEEISKEWEKENPIYNWIDTKLFPSGKLFGYAPHYSLTHPHVLLADLFREFKWAWQRVVRKWDDRVVWSVDYWLDSIMPDILRKLSEKKQGIPMFCFEGLSMNENFEYSDEDHEKAGKIWDSIIQEMISGFEASKALDDLYIKTTFEEYKIEAKEMERKRRKGMLLFVKHYNSLWD